MQSSTHTYHHGNLQEALLEAAIAKARVKGPASLGLRALARDAGVTPPSVYRHFKSQQALLVAVKDRIAGMLADTIRMQLARAPQTADSLERVGVICRAYIHFARVEPGLFQTACDPTIVGALAAEAHQPTHNEPFRILQQAIEGLVRDGFASPSEDPLQLSIVVWAAAHGLAVLLTAGPLSTLPGLEQEQIIAKTLNTIMAGIQKV